MEKDGEVRGTIRFGSADDEAQRSGEFEGQVAGRKILLTGRVSLGNFEAEIVLEGEIEKDEMNGKTTWKFPQREDVRPFRATRTPKQGAGSR